MDTEVAHKFSQIRQLLEQTYKKKKKGKSSSGYVVGLFTTQQQDEIAWIAAELRLAGELVKEIRYIDPSKCKIKDIDKAISECTFYIYILTEHKWKHVLSNSEKKKALASFGKKNLVVLIVDMEDSSDEERSRIIKGLPSIKECAMDLFLFKKIQAKPEKPQDIGFDRLSINTPENGPPANQLAAPNVDLSRNPSYRLPQPEGRDGPPANQLAAANVDLSRNPSYRLPQPEGRDGPSQNQLAAANVDRFRNPSYRLPQPEDGPFENQLAAANVDRFRTPPYHPPQPEGTGGSYENKFRNIPYRLPQPATGPQTGMAQRFLDKKHIVGIFTKSGEQDFSWLTRLLTEAFQDCVGEVKYCYITNNGYEKLSDDLSDCTFGILYHTKKRGRINITNVTESLYDEELETISAELGRRNTIVVIDDLDDGSDEEKNQILQAQHSISKLACDLILIAESDKANILKLTTKTKHLKFIFAGEHSVLKIQNAVKPDPPPNPRPEPPYIPNGAGNASPVLSRERMPVAVATSKPTVAIFSKSEEIDYSWLSQQLSSEGLDVRTYKISSLNKDQPHEMAFQCKLVILYHNMHDGKLRLTDAKDAMYHEELEMLSYKFGKRRMIVVVDDLVESNDKIKSEILERQPSTGRFARELFLISMKEKKHLNKKEPSKEARKLMDKIIAIKEMVTK